ncbi:DUF3592 domain-containing protein [Nocardioides sp. CFH 31398]|uniref:DUF3592 domain-containing protein n=1 Tax=Nocardioides sp. CFH 31398 TaxID=2919579 RepID=UPI001F0599F9|nr:DUF3592 domain-containing protein [Nocardioides sp. CFH 31398]MCH1866321.1 DUF3592 domain-containing protein [Nocardioides sp. CFH 31398]
MSTLLDGAPWVFLLIPLLIAAAFVALPTVVLVGALRSSRRRRTWTPVQGVVTATRVESRGAGDSRRTVVVGRYTYRGPDGVERTGSGPLGSVWMDETSGVRRIDVLVDPSDPDRSTPATAPTGPVAAVFLGLVLSVFFVIGASILLLAGGVLLARW